MVGDHIAPRSHRPAVAMPAMCLVAVAAIGVLIWRVLPFLRAAPTQAGRPRAIPVAQQAPNLDSLRTAALAAPVDYTARSRYGMALAESGKTVEAEQELLAAARLSPEAPVVHHNLGVLYLNTGRAALADAEFRRELETAPGDGRAHYYRGLALQAMKRPNLAVAQFRLAMELAPQMPDPYLQLAILLEPSSNPATVRPLVDRYLALGGTGQAVADFVLCKTYLGARDYNEAARWGEKAVAASPGSGIYWYNLGRAYSFLNRTADSDRALQRAAEISHMSAAYYGLGVNATKSGRFREAIDWYKRCLAAGSKDNEIHYSLALAYERTGDMESSRRERAAFRRGSVDMSEGVPQSVLRGH